jgi:hypothetical protein
VHLKLGSYKGICCLHGMQPSLDAIGQETICLQEQIKEYIYMYGRSMHTRCLLLLCLQWTQERGETNDTLLGAWTRQIHGQFGGLEGVPPPRVAWS